MRGSADIKEVQWQSSPLSTKESPQETLTEAWKKDVQRLIRRAEITRQLGSNLPINEIIGAVREYERSLGVEKMVESLISENFVVNPRIKDIATDLSDRLKDEFPFMKAIVLLGSSVHGGAMIREAMGTFSEEHDLDWGIITDGYVDYEKPEGLYKAARKILPGIGKKNGIEKNFQSCGMFNPSWQNAPNLRDEADALDMVKNLKETTDILIRKPFLYFYPSVPAEVNERNRHLVLDSLKVLYKKDRKSWRVLVNMIVDIWSDSHRIKRKHFLVHESDIPSRKNGKIIDRVDAASSRVMSVAMRTLLESTANG